MAQSTFRRVASVLGLGGWRTLSRLAVMLAVLLFAPEALGQVVREAGPLVWPVTRRELDTYASMLRMETAQKHSLLELYQGYRSALRLAIDEGNKAFAAAEKAAADPAKPGGGIREEFAAVDGFVRAAHRLEAAFFEDAKALLNAEQSASFIRVERARRRATGLRFSFAAGERADPVALLDELRIERAGPLAEVLDQYEVEADRLMISKAELLQKLFRMVHDLRAKDEEPALEQISEVFKELGEHSFKVQEVNRRAVRQVSELLAEGPREKFDLAVLRRSFPTVYAATLTERTLAAAAGLGDLTADQRAEIAALREQHAREAGVIRARWAAEIEEKQRLVADKGLEALMMLEGGGEDDPLAIVRRDRTVLAERTGDRLDKILGEEQRGRVSKDAADNPHDREDSGSVMDDVFPDLGRDHDGYDQELDEPE